MNDPYHDLSRYCSITNFEGSPQSFFNLSQQGNVDSRGIVKIFISLVRPSILSILLPILSSSATAQEKGEKSNETSNDNPREILSNDLSKGIHQFTSKDGKVIPGTLVNYDEEKAEVSIKLASNDKVVTTSINNLSPLFKGMVESSARLAKQRNPLANMDLPQPVVATVAFPFNYFGQGVNTCYYTTQAHIAQRISGFNFDRKLAKMIMNAQETDGAKGFKIIDIKPLNLLVGAVGKEYSFNKNLPKKQIEESKRVLKEELQSGKRVAQFLKAIDENGGGHAIVAHAYDKEENSLIITNGSIPTFYSIDELDNKWGSFTLYECPEYDGQTPLREYPVNLEVIPSGEAMSFLKKSARVSRLGGTRTPDGSDTLTDTPYNYELGSGMNAHNLTARIGKEEVSDETKEGVFVYAKLLAAHNRGVPVCLIDSSELEKKDTGSKNNPKLSTYLVVGYEGNIDDKTKNIKLMDRKGDMSLVGFDEFSKRVIHENESDRLVSGERADSDIKGNKLAYFIFPDESMPLSE